MKLKQVRVETFKSILDSTPVDIQSDVTCIVGKNESGKSAFLTSLYRLNPANHSAVFSVQKHYPAWLEKKHRREGKVLEEVTPITADFELEPADWLVIEGRFGKGTLTSKIITVSRSYAAKPIYAFNSSEANAVAFILTEVQLPSDFQTAGSEAKTLPTSPIFWKS